MSVISSFLGAIVFTALQFIVFFFVLVATPISMFDIRNSRSACYTLWGFKSRCHSTWYTRRGISAFGCGQRRNNMNGGAAFAIFSIILTLIAFIFGIFMLCQISCMVVMPLVCSVAAFFTLLISWACVAGVYNITMCGGSQFSSFTVYGAGFGLLVTAWVLQGINVVWLIIAAFA